MRTRCLIGFRLLSSVAFILIAGYGVTATPTRAADAPASLTIDVYTCDDLHDPIDPNQTLANECALGTEDIPFTLEPISPSGGPVTASTGTGGAPAAISFTQLAPGTYRLSQATPDSIGGSYIATCISNVRTFDYPFDPFAIIEPHGRLNIELLPGEQLACDWYNIQAPAAATSSTLTVTVYSCSGDVIDPELCDRAPHVELRLFGPSAEVILTTDSTGIATYDGQGTFQIEPVSQLDERVFCGFQTETGTHSEMLTLDPANPIALDSFYCYPGA